jgi:hypothetical protein
MAVRYPARHSSFHKRRGVFPTARAVPESTDSVNARVAVGAAAGVMTNEDTRLRIGVRLPGNGVALADSVRPESVTDQADATAFELDLVRRAQAGDEQAFGQLVERNRRAVYRAAYAALGSADDADDVAQETFVAV